MCAVLLPPPRCVCRERSRPVVAAAAAAASPSNVAAAAAASPSNVAAAAAASSSSNVAAAAAASKKPFRCKRAVSASSYPAAIFAATSTWLLLPPPSHVHWQPSPLQRQPSARCASSLTNRCGPASSALVSCMTRMLCDHPPSLPTTSPKSETLNP